MIPELAVFDFDGTLTRKDSLFEFVKFTHGKRQLYIQLLSILPIIVLNKLGFISSKRLKESFMEGIYKNVKEAKMWEWGKQFADTVLPALILPEAEDRLQWHISQNHEVLILSASFDVWLQPWCEVRNFELVSSKLEVVEDHITGKMNGENCKGKEKKRRLKAFLSLRKFAFVYGYGDSRSDKYFYKLVDEVQHKPY